MTTTTSRAIRKALHLLARPVRRARARQGVVLQPYRGYGSARELFLIGRVFRQPGRRGAGEAPGTVQDLRDVGRRVLRRGVRDAEIVARFEGVETTVVTDRDGYFRVHLHLPRPPASPARWQKLELELRQPVQLTAQGEIYLAPPQARYVVISDIDDTIMKSGVARKLVMLWRIYVQGPKSRVAFPGMAAFLRALFAGAGGGEGNPMLYVSRAPWSTYEVLEAFFHLHRIPEGPLLFLREWGMTLQSPRPRRGRRHKLVLIRHMLALYRDLPFILIGDTTQRDPEIYAQIVAEHPGRVRAVYIRDVRSDRERLDSVQQLAEQVARAGSSLVLAADSLAMARHALELGLIAPATLAEIGGEAAEAAADRTESDALIVGAAPRPGMVDEAPAGAAQQGDRPGSPARSVDELAG